MSNQESKVVKTKAKITDALIVLIESKRLEKISVADICHEAQINRGTFYLHYVDKPDLLAKVELNLISQFDQVLTKNMPSPVAAMEHLRETNEVLPVVKQSVTLINTNFTLFRALTSDNGDPAFLTKLRSLIKKHLTGTISEVRAFANLTTNIPPKFADELIVFGLIDICLVWLNGDNPQPPEIICQIVMKSLFWSPFDLLASDRSI
ncbi:TetR/AcrR family transcriptional regulator [Paucilactobacillus suebicus]|uniref:TetR family transcriptional regulator n=1 Tax=Paucilactobacillus suebicus DSM 5007 = KCTC 3549 TaxID=1423807 RepID=A0A0R1W3B3_9LACO|nr:TetR/AcrR family transcriptional regulator [Paucilactobacillus suebicus]KRM12270.1 TetR family transcriptional regulator [Paucilactobacillus suebicus DSM 5007 = KCTC 3549]